MGYDLGYIDLEEKTLLPLDNPFGPGVLPSFSKDIQPILETSCWKCHGATLQLSKLDLRTRESALKGAEHGIVPRL